MATLGALAELTGGDVVGDADQQVVAISDLVSAGPEHVSFLTHPRYTSAFRATRAGAVITAERLTDAPCALIVCADPYLATAQVARALHPLPPVVPGISPGAHVHPEARVDPTASVGPGTVVGAHAFIGARTQVEGGCTVGREARVGEDCHLHPGARVLDACRLGDRVILHAGVVVGSDGFGFAADRATGRRVKIPQVGRVEIDDDVEVGANTTIDRATFGATRIGAGTKIDNLVQIAHNVVVGRDCVIVSQTGIAGSTVVGDRVVMGAQGGVVGHIEVTDDVMLGARAGVASSIDKPGIYSGAPAVPHRQWLKTVTAQHAVPELRRRVRALEARLQALASPVE